MKKVEIIKIPYKPFRKKIIRRFSKKSLISFSIKSYMNFRGEDLQGNPLLALLKDLGSVLKEITY